MYKCRGTVMLLLALPLTVDAQSIRGVVVSEMTQRPAIRAEVSLPEVRRTTQADSAGRFEIGGLSAGVYRMQIRVVGHAPFDTSVRVAEAVVELRIALRTVVALDTVSVAAASAIPSFDEHRAIGLGKFLTRQDLEKVKGRRTATVLTQVPGIRIVEARQTSGAANAAFVGTRGRGSVGLAEADPARGDNRLVVKREGYCLANVYLDGTMVYSGRPRDVPFDVNSVSVAQIEAIEYYANQAQTPMRYSRGNTDCGVLVIHTRRSR